ncbi:Serine carboxypeptidase 1 [Ananas comosus]|uniref:Carboxypeptidase n=1 Tax=Ananas comosus TaxID=4615 RepID=A0A199VSB4_ANACO|nr:Serine carboxypeptidase 1 [Ananas comosus]
MEASTATLTISVLLLLSILSSIAAAPESALITHLPGFDGSFPSKHYSGYTTVDEEHGRNLFYYFVVSERNPAQDPVVLWLNGGPGCSSFDGFVYEHVWRSTWKPPEATSQSVSNIIYLDSPAGVGLSYSNNSSDYATGDLKTASDSHTFLLKWFEQYPEFLANPFYISGESYAGVYVPTLSYEGYMVGNGVSDTVFDGDALVPFAHGMGLISNDLFQEVYSACNGSYWNPVNNNCLVLLSKVDWELDNLNIYDILEPCFHSPEVREVLSEDSRLPSSFRKLGETDRPLPVRKRMFGRAWPLRAPVRDGRVPTWPELGSSSVPCTDDEVATSWLNNEAVRSAIHAQPRSLIGAWELCTNKIDFDHDAGSMIKYHKNLTAQDYRALIYRYAILINV